MGLEEIPISAHQAEGAQSVSSNETQSKQWEPTPLPSPLPLQEATFKWGEADSAEVTNALNRAYAEVVHWKKNTFTIPVGSTGMGFVLELSKLLRAYAESSALEGIALKAYTVMSTVLLQKPSHKARRKELCACLERRLNVWKKGDFESLVEEGRILQNRLRNNNEKKKNDENVARSFTNLMFQGKINAALQLLEDKCKGGILKTTDRVAGGENDTQSVLDVLISKHPKAKQPQPESLPFDKVDPPNIHPVIFNEINASTIRRSALKTKGAAGPSGLDAYSWRRMCTSFKSASQDLCHSLALLARRLCTSNVNPDGLSPLLACRLIALDKCPGVRPIGICNTARRILAKAILSVLRDDIQEAAGPKQLCAGQIAGIEAAIHAMKSTFSDDETDAVLLIDASNAFNSLNRQAALRNVQHLCPSIATILINTYRAPTELFIDGKVLWSEEGTTQGDPLAMPFYALATIPLINDLSSVENIKQAWYADDAAAAGRLQSLRTWWDTVNSKGPAYGYHANASKTWLVVKEEHLEEARMLFEDTEVNITPKGRPYLGAALGSKEFVTEMIASKIESWEKELGILSEIATTQPHSSYAAFIHGFTHKFNYLLRCNPGISHQLKPLEDTIRLKLIPAWTGRPPPSDLERELFSLPARHGGLGIVNPVKQADAEFSASLRISGPLCELIVSQSNHYSWETLNEQLKGKHEIQEKRSSDEKERATNLRSSLNNQLQLAMELAQEKGGSNWLTALPLKEHGFTLHKGAFRDAIALRYGWLPTNCPTNCACSSPFSVEHALSCSKGGFPSIRHNEVRDTIGSWMSEVCNDVCIEPPLQPLEGETLHGATSIKEDGARLDIAANGFWGGRYERAFFDVRVFNPHAPSNRQQSLPQTYRKHERAKIRAYEERVREIEHGSFTPLVMSLSGGLGNAAKVCLRRLASMLSEKWDLPYSTTLAWMRCTLSFTLLRSSIQSIRGARSSRGCPQRPCLLPCDLTVSEAGIRILGD